jgi:PD-(D/E)XK nuclease superfamily
LENLTNPDSAYDRAKCSPFHACAASLLTEIWDYKGGHRPRPNSQDLRRYEFQMLLYAELYRERNGVYPVKVILYFPSELDA